MVQGYSVLKIGSELNKFTEDNDLSAIASTYLKAYVDMLANLPVMLLKRRRFREKDRLSNIDMFCLIWKFHLSMNEIIGVGKLD
jgi:hypothetical protein